MVLIAVRNTFFHNHTKYVPTSELFFTYSGRGGSGKINNKRFIKMFVDI